MFKLLVSPIIICVGIYIFFFLKRSYLTVLKREYNIKSKIILIAISLVISLLCFNISGMFVVSVLHIVGISALLSLANLLLEKGFNENYKKGCRLWKNLYGSGILAIFLSVVILFFGFVNMNNVVRTEYKITTDKNIKSDGYRVAVLADIHFGVSIDENELNELCERVSEEKADIVVLCGDIVDDGTDKEGLETVFSALGKIKSEHGVIYVYGNHDRPFNMISSSYTEDELNNAISSNGIKILEDEIYEINGDFAIVGRNDSGFDGRKRKSIEELLNQIDKNKYILTLDHKPCEYEENGKAGTNLLVSGHTHGGQLWPVNIIDKVFKINDSNYGFTQIDDDTSAIVTSGVAGWAYPIKTSAPAEYVIIDILKEK